LLPSSAGAEPRGTHSEARLVRIVAQADVRRRMAAGTGQGLHQIPLGIGLHAACDSDVRTISVFCLATLCRTAPPVSELRGQVTTRGQAEALRSQVRSLHGPGCPRTTSRTRRIWRHSVQGSAFSPEPRTCRRNCIVDGRLGWLSSITFLRESRPTLASHHKDLAFRIEAQVPTSNAEPPHCPGGVVQGQVKALRAASGYPE
jgi:hypothetical protein